MDTLSEAFLHTVLLSRGRGTLVQDAVLTLRQMLGGWPGYEKGTATTCYLTSGGFGKSTSATPLAGIVCGLNVC